MVPGTEVIRSRTNPVIKRVGAVHAGKLQGRLLLEGDRLIDDAVEAGCEVEIVLVAEDRAERARELAPHVGEVRLVETSLLERLSQLEHSPGVIAVAGTPPEPTLADLDLAVHSRLLVACGVADPGNLGALARSAEAFGARALCVVRGGASPWNAKALRGSMGSLLRLPVLPGLDPEAFAQELRALDVRQVVAATRGGRDLGGFDWTGPLALWIGSETGDLPETTRDFERVTIPMRGAVESLNVAVAASLLFFAAAHGAGGER